ncbi:MAG: T9SS type A sorting domain-containing protein [Chitinophagales bacterium]|nr:T9SS type A sorting domain-containing protein [Chitinophagales bacterium]MDW8428562.1 T9SS type A sorting domain-containing protein [Chitinophagales bacterium]
MKPKNAALWKKLKQYSAITAPLVAGASLAQGQVVYTDLDPDVELQVGDEFALDLNNDGNIDFKFKVVTYGTNWWRAGLAPYPYYTTNQNAFAGYVNTIGGLLKIGYASALEEGAVIDANNDWKVINDLVFSYNNNLYFIFAALASTYGGGAYGQWIGGVGDRYVGLRFSPDGTSTHYGWMRAEVSESDKKLTLKEYAYEQTPEVGLTAGTTIGLPQVGTMGVRIFGYEGVVHVLAEHPQGAILRITNAIGQVVAAQDLDGHHTSVNLNEFGKGIYLVTVMQGSDVVSRKVSFR